MKNNFTPTTFSTDMSAAHKFELDESKNLDNEKFSHKSNSALDNKSPITKLEHLSISNLPVKQGQKFYYTLFKILADHTFTVKHQKDKIVSLFSSTTDLHKIFSERDAMGIIFYEYKFGNYQAAFKSKEEYDNDESIYTSISDHTSLQEEYYDDGIGSKASDNTNELEKDDCSSLIGENVVDSDEEEIFVDNSIKIEQNLSDPETDQFDYWIMKEYLLSGSILNYCLNQCVDETITEFIITNLGNKLDVLRYEEGEFLWTPYHLAAFLCKANILKLLLQTNQNKPISYGLRPYMSPLHVAAYKGNSEIIRILLEDGRFNDEINKHDCYGKTVLHEAAHNGNLKSFNLLLSCPDIDTSSKTMRLLYPAFDMVPKEATARELTLYYNHLYEILNLNKPTTQLCGSILTTQLDTNLVSIITSDNPLFGGLKKNEVDFPENHWEEMKKLYKTPYGIFLAAAGEFEELIIHLQVRGLNALNEQNWQGRNILHVACDYGRLEIIKFLLNLNSLREVIPNITEQLHKEFVNKKAGSQHVTPMGRTIIEDWPTNVMRTEAIQSSIIESFLKCNSYDPNLYYSTLHNQNLLHYACENSMEWLVRELFKREDLNPNLKDRDGKVALRLIKDKSIMQIFLNNPKNLNIDVDDSFEDGPLNTALSSWSEESRFGDTVSLPDLTTNKLAEIFRTGKIHNTVGTYDKAYVELEYKVNGNIEQKKLDLLKRIIAEEIEIEENLEDICCLVDSIRDKSNEENLRKIIRDQLNSRNCSRNYEDDDFDNFIFLIDNATITATIISRSRRATDATFKITRNHLVDMVSSDLRNKLEEQNLTHITSIAFKETEQNNDFLEIDLRYDLQQNNSIKSKGFKNIIKQSALERENLRLTCDVYSSKVDILTKQQKEEIHNTMDTVSDLCLSYFSQKKPLLHYFVHDAVKTNDIELLSLFLRFPKLSLQQPNDQLKLATSYAKGNKDVLKLLNDALKQSNLVGSTIRSSSAYSDEYKQVALSQISKKEAKQALKKHITSEAYSTDHKKGSISPTNSMVSHFRGIHFNTKYFTFDQRRRYGLQSQHNKPIFAADCYTNSGVDFNHELRLDEINSLNSISVQLHKILYQDLDYERRDQRANYSFVQNYVLNEVSELQNLVQEAELIIQQANLRSLKNPFVSTSKVALPAAKFTSASSGYRELNPDVLQPKYRAHGVPKHRLLGITYLIIHTIEDYGNANPFDIPQLYKNQEIQLPLQKNGNPKYLSQVEVAFVGNIDAKNVVAAIPFLVPNFARDWDQQFQKLYGIDKKKYDCYKDRFSNSIVEARTKQCNQEDVLRLIEQELIQNLEFHYSKLLGSIAKSIAAEQNKKLLVAMPDGSYIAYAPQQEKQIKDQIIIKSMQKINQRVIPAEHKSTTYNSHDITQDNSLPSETKKPPNSNIASLEYKNPVKDSKSYHIGIQTLENNADAFDIDVPSDGNCLFYSLIMSYLLPYINNEQEFTSRYSKIFIGTHALLFALMKQYDGNDTWYKKNLYRLVNDNVCGLRSKLADYFNSIKDRSFNDKVIEQFEGLSTKKRVCDYIKQANVFGNMGEMMLFASLTKRSVAYYPCYSFNKPLFIRPNGIIIDEVLDEVDVTRVFFVELKNKEGDKVGHYHFLIPKEQLPQVLYSKLGIDINIQQYSGLGNNTNTNLRIAEKNILHAMQIKHLQKFLIKTKDADSIIHTITNSEDISALPGPIRLIKENDHVAFHKYNILRVINMLYSDTIRSNTVICLERKQYGNNFGMRDVALLAKILQTDGIPEYVRNLPIYYDALLYNEAKAKGIQVIGIEGKGLPYTKESPYYNQAREEYMAQQLVDIAKSGKNPLFLVGSAHINNLVELLGNQGFRININYTNLTTSSSIQLVHTDLTPEINIQPEHLSSSAGQIPSWQQRVIPKPILNQVNEFKGESTECTILHEYRRDPQNSFASFKMGNGINQNDIQNDIVRSL